MLKTLKQAITDFIEFIYLLSEMSKMCSSNDSKIWFKPLIYFELQQSLNSNFKLKPLQIRYQLMPFKLVEFRINRVRIKRARPVLYFESDYHIICCFVVHIVGSLPQTYSSKIKRL